MSASPSPKQINAYIKKKTLPRSECEMKVILRNKFEEMRLKNKIHDIDDSQLQLRDEQYKRSIDMKEKFAEVVENSGYSQDGEALGTSKVDHQATVEMKMYVKPWKLFHHVTENDTVGSVMRNFNLQYGLKGLQRLNDHGQIPKQTRSEMSREKMNVPNKPKGVDTFNHEKIDTPPRTRSGITPRATKLSLNSHNCITDLDMSSVPEHEKQDVNNTDAAFRTHGFPRKKPLLDFKIIKVRRPKTVSVIQSACSPVKSDEFVKRQRPRTVPPKTVSVIQSACNPVKSDEFVKGQRPRTVPLKTGSVIQSACSPVKSDEFVKGQRPRTVPPSFGRKDSECTFNKSHNNKHQSISRTKISTKSATKANRWINLDYYVKPQDRYKKDFVILKRMERLHKNLAMEKDPSANEGKNELKLHVAYSKTARQRELNKLIEMHSEQLKNQQKPENPKSFDNEVHEFLRSVNEFVASTPRCLSNDHFIEFR